MKNKKKSKKEQKKIHPMWFLLFMMLGLTISIMVTSYEPALILSLVGIMFMLIFTSTPSKNIKYQKTNLQSVFVWCLVITMVIMLIIILLTNLEVI